MEICPDKSQKISIFVCFTDYCKIIGNNRKQLEIYRYE